MTSGVKLGPIWRTIPSSLRLWAIHSMNPPRYSVGLLIVLLGNKSPKAKRRCCENAPSQRQVRPTLPRSVGQDIAKALKDLTYTVDGETVTETRHLLDRLVVLGEDHVAAGQA